MEINSVKDAASIKDGNINDPLDPAYKKPDTVNFLEDNYSQDFIGGSTKPSSEPPRPEGYTQSDVLGYEDSRSKGMMSSDEVEKVAKFMIDTFDTGLSMILAAIAKDSSSTAYSISNPNKKTLIDQLTLILVKRQVKFKVEYLFLIALVTIYSAPVALCISKRRDISNEKKLARKKQMTIDHTLHQADEINKGLKEKGDQLNDDTINLPNKTAKENIPTADKTKAGRKRGRPTKFN